MLSPFPEPMAVLRRLRPARADALDALWAAPTQVVVVGRLGVGKTTLINGWADENRPVGLGGVTQFAESIKRADWHWVDTPGIDNPDRALSVLGPLVDQADALVWVVDGLQPATHTARLVVEELADPGQALVVLCSRLDLVPAAEHNAVLKRLRAHTPPNTVVMGGDLRAWVTPPPDTLNTPSPRRLRATKTAFQDLLNVLEASPIRDQQGWQRRLVDVWHQQLQGATDHVLDLLEKGAVSGESTALVWLSDTHPRLNAAVSAACPPAMERPVLPRLRLDSTTAMDRVAAAMGGPERARRRIRQAAGAWMLDGDMAIADWAGDHPLLDAAARQQRSDRDVLVHALAAL